VYENFWVYTLRVNQNKRLILRKLILLPVATIGLILGLYLLWSAFDGYVYNPGYRRYTGRAEGVVTRYEIGLRSAGSPPRSISCPIVNFTAKDGRESEDFMCSARGAKIGERVSLLYGPRELGATVKSSFGLPRVIIHLLANGLLSLLIAGVAYMYSRGKVVWKEQSARSRFRAQSCLRLGWIFLLVPLFILYAPYLGVYFFLGTFLLFIPIFLLIAMLLFVYSYVKGNKPILSLVGQNSVVVCLTVISIFLYNLIYNS
jgi:hypothetical protein